MIGVLSSLVNFSIPFDYFESHFCFPLESDSALFCLCICIRTHIFNIILFIMAM